MDIKDSNNSGLVHFSSIEIRGQTVTVIVSMFRRIHINSDDVPSLTT